MNRAVPIRAARPEAVDIALAGLTAGWGLFVLAAPVPAAVQLTSLLFTVGQAVAILLRATSPAVTVLTIGAALPMQIFLGSGPVGLTLLLAAFLVGLHGGARLLVVAFAAAGAASWAVIRLRGGAHAAATWLEITGVGLLLLVLLAYGAGRLRRAGRERQRRRREAAERERVAAALAGERRRIAGDVAGVVLDELRRVTALAAGLRAAVATAQPGPALAELQQAARRALASMRRVVTVLRAADAGAPTGPGPAPRRWWEPGLPGPSGWIVVAALTAGTAITASLAVPPTGEAAVDRLLAYLDLPLDRPVLLAVIAVQLVATAWWRAAPIPALIVVTAASVVLSQADATQLIAETGWMVLVYASGSWAPVRVSAPAVGLISLVVVVELALAPRMAPLTSSLEWVLSWGETAFVWGLGVAVRGARLRVQRARAADADSLLRTRLDDERHRIARELHDLVAHHASAVAVQAAAARSAPDAVPAAVEHIEESGRAIADAVRSLAGLDPEREPGVSLTRAGVETLLDQARAAGVPVAVEVAGEPSAEPGEADLFARRILAEALTNVLRHAGPSPTRLRVEHEPGAVTVEVQDAGPAAGHRPVTTGSGLGLVGMRERAALLGGTLEAGPHGGGWRIHARLPRSAPPASPTPARQRGGITAVQRQ